MKKDTRYSIRKLSVGVASIAVASFLAGGSADAANLSPLYSKQANPELPFEPFPSEIEYTQAETPWTPQESAEVETPVEENPVESSEFTEAEAPFADRVIEEDPEFTEAEAPFADRVIEEDPEFTEAEAPFADRVVKEDPEFTEAEAPFADRVVEEDPEFTEAEAPFANRDEEVSEPSKANYDNPESPFAPVEEEVSEPSDANFVNPEDPFAEDVPANGENPEDPYGEGYPANGENPEAPYSEGVPSNQVTPEAPFAPAQELGEEEPGEDSEEETEAPDLTELTPAEEVVDDLTPLEPAEEVVDDLTPLESAEEVVDDLTPLEPAEEVVDDLTPLEPAEEVVDDLTPLEPAEEVVDDLTPLEPAEEVVDDLTPLEPAEEVVDDLTPLEPAEEVVGDLTPLEPAEEVVGDLTPLEPAEEVVGDLTPLEPAVVTEVKEETRTEETLQVIEKEDPELLEGKSRVEEGTPKVTEITEKVTYEDGKEVSRKEVSRKVIDEGTPEIKYTGTKPAIVTEVKEETRTEETLQVIEKEDPELLEGKIRVEEGTPKVTEITEEVTYEDGKEVFRKEVSSKVIDEGTPEIKYTGTKKDTPVEWTVNYGIPQPSEEALKIVKDTRGTFKAEVDQISELFELGLQMLILKSPSQSSKEFYQKVLDASQTDEGQTVIADFLDYYRKSKDKTSLTLEDLVMDSAGKTGGIYETMILAAADKLGVDSIESGQTPEAYKQLMGNYMLGPSDGSNIYKDVMKNGDFGAYAPRKEAVDDVNKTYANVKSLIIAGHSAFRQIRKDYSLTEEDTLAGSLDYYRALTKQPEASLKDVIVDLANYSFDLPGAIQMVQHYDPSVKGLSDVVANYKRVMTTTKQGHAMQSELDFFTKEVQSIIDGLGIDLANVTE